MKHENTYRKGLRVALLLAALFGLHRAQGQVIISEYHCGSGNSRAVELYNPTASRISLAGYALAKEANGAGGFTTTLGLTGYIEPWGTYVVAHADAATALVLRADTVSFAVVEFNGDDPIALLQGGVVVDQLGTPRAANTSDYFGKDCGYVRKPGALTGRTGYQDPRSNGEWTAVALGDYSRLGYHQGQQASATAGQNYVVTVKPVVGATSTAAVDYPQQRATVSYFDGLGRPLQTVSAMAGGQTTDLVQPVVYDDLGREKFQHLPYAAPGSGTSGALKGSWAADQKAFYAGLIPGEESAAFAETDFEASPLSRVLKTYAPGKAWTKAITGNKPKGYAYATNATSEVLLLRVQNDGSLKADGYYAAGTLSRTTVTDEEGYTVDEWKDMEGRVVMRRTTVESKLFRPQPPKPQYWVYTYAATLYAYDDFGRLRWVVPPLATSALGNGATLLPADATADQLCYQYTYDSRGRMSGKKLPGAGWTWMVYDAGDRVVLSQDAEQGKSNRWMVTTYDALGRPSKAIEAAVSAQPTPTVGQAEVQARYDAGTLQLLAPAPLTQSYYDSYPFNAANNPLKFRENSCALQAALRANVTGLPTATTAWVLGGTAADMLTTATYYDQQGRAIQQVAQQPGGRLQVVSFQLRWDGQPAAVLTELYDKTGALTASVLEEHAYDHMGRPLGTMRTVVGPVAGARELAASYRYDALGRQSVRRVGGNRRFQWLEREQTTYTIRGWLASINNPLTTTSYAQSLAYDRRGNITSMDWITPDKDSPERALQRYAYTYDGLSRLTQGTYSQPTTGLKANGYSEALTYDLNGNITSLNRYAPQGAAAGVIDQLTYRYSGNQLTGVTDNASSYKAQGYVDGSPEAVDRTYDALGRMVADKDRGVAVAYNLLSLPKEVKSLADANDKISYIYDATGRKLAARNMGKATIYAGMAVIDSAAAGEKVAFLLNGEGRLVLSSGSYRQEYFLKDHLGNTRVVVARNGDGSKALVSTNSYYPFGLEMPYDQNLITGTANPYRYNGKELQTFMQVAGRSLEWYDYGARFYEPAIGRFHSIDKMSEATPNITPHRYAFNNPLKYIDADGNFEMDASQAQQYQRLAQYLKNGIQEIANNPKVMDALMKYGQFSKRDIVNDLKWGKGPKIKVTPLFEAFGAFTPGIGSKELQLSEQYVKLLDKLTGKGRDALLFLLAVKILHEYTHYGDDQDGIDYEGIIGDAEEGRAFELTAYGTIINGENASSIIELWKKQQQDNKQQEETSKKKKGLNHLFENFNNLQEGKYEWDGTSWIKTD